MFGLRNAVLSFTANHYTADKRIKCDLKSNDVYTIAISNMYSQSLFVANLHNIFILAQKS